MCVAGRVVCGGGVWEHRLCAALESSSPTSAQRCGDAHTLTRALVESLSQVVCTLQRHARAHSGGVSVRECAVRSAAFPIAADCAHSQRTVLGFSGPLHPLEQARSRVGFVLRLVCQALRTSGVLCARRESALSVSPHRTQQHHNGDNDDDLTVKMK